MQTLMLQADDEGIRRAAEIIQQGGLVGIPTETVYGLAGNALNGSVSQKIFAAKGRPSDNPLIVHIAAAEEARPLVKEFPEPAQKLAAAYWPGPLTMVLPKSELVPMETSGGLSTVAVRLPGPSGGKPADPGLWMSLGRALGKPVRKAQPHHGAAYAPRYGWQD